MVGLRITVAGLQKATRALERALDERRQRECWWWYFRLPEPVEPA